jgi:hypothetical protein
MRSGDFENCNSGMRNGRTEFENFNSYRCALWSYGVENFNSVGSKYQTVAIIATHLRPCLMKHLGRYEVVTTHLVSLQGHYPILLD